MIPGACRATVLVIGARGFLGSCIAAHLRERGYRVLAGVRSPESGSDEERRCDLSRMMVPEQWDDALQEVDVVVNAAGILRERGAQTFDAVHVRGPVALAQACVGRGVRRFVQVSALGDPRDGEFIASKHRFDAALLEMPLSAVVLRPSVVHAAEGSYGGSSLLRALAALPCGVWLPGDGHWLLQPLDARDLAELVVRAVESDVGGMFEAGGPSPVSLRGYLQQWRKWLRVPGTRVREVPTWLVSLAAAIAEHLGRGPLGATMWRMLRRGNVTAPYAPKRVEAAFGFAPRALAESLLLHPARVQDRWHARLYFLAPLLRAALAGLWLLSGLAGLLAGNTDIAAVTGAALPALPALALARSAAVVDLVLAVWLASGWRTRWALAGMAASVVVYTIAFSLWLPAAWLAPLGGLAKNIVVLPAIAVLWVLDDRR
ncbi:MAG TPA: SDR family oxidoreductase [Rhodanobacteraceae bacterium]|nr:SDR family oxidoreductase [Rhodanobacteraceae bacterium]